MYHHLSVSEKFTYDAKMEFEGTFMKYIMKIVYQLEMTFAFYREQKLPTLTVFEATLRL